MEINGLKVLEGRMSNVNLKDFLNPKFSELLEKEMEEAKIIHLGIAVGSKDEQRLISLAHVRPEDIKDNELTIDVPKEEHLDQILNIIKLLSKEE